MDRYLSLSGKLFFVNRRLARLEKILAQHKASGIRPLFCTLELYQEKINERGLIMSAMTSYEDRFADLLPGELLMKLIDTGETIKFTL